LISDERDRDTERRTETTADAVPEPGSVSAELVALREERAEEEAA
jgi:hypothetical protein